MTDTSLKDRLRDHAEAFDSLLSLIPAKLYYGEDTNDQWQRKKQTKEQARAAKRGRLDPDSELNRTAKEVLDERARSKRKAIEMDEDSSNDDDEPKENKDEVVETLDGIEQEQPRQGLKIRKSLQDEPNKKARLADDGQDDTEEALSELLSAHQEKKLSKKQKKTEKKAERKKTRAEKPAANPTVAKTLEDVGTKTSTEDVMSQDEAISSKEEDEEEEGSFQKKDMRHIDISGIADDEDGNCSSQSSTPASPTFDSPEAETHPSTEPASTTTSIASEAAGAGTSERPSSSSSKKLKVPSDTTELRARLAAKIAALRAARKADGPDGTPIRTRAELIESRRKKEAERKAHKKELRRQAKEAEDKKREEALASARNSPMLSFGSSPGSPVQEASFSFGRVAFADGTQMSQDLSYVKDKSGRKKGPTDPKGALAKLEAQKRRLATLDADKRKEVLEKETWLAARRRAEGEKVRDDETLLKKAVKRKDKTKKKSEREWSERAEGVKTAQKQKQARREKNIRERKEAKMAGKAGRKGKGKSPAKKKGRPGFEGSGFGGKRK